MLSVWNIQFRQITINIIIHRKVLKILQKLMKNTSEHTSIRSKYGDSSHKIKKLYLEFEHLKQRMSTPIKNKKQYSGTFKQLSDFNYSSQFKTSTKTYSLLKDQYQKDEAPKNAIDNETKTLFRAIVQKFITNNLSITEKTMENSIDECSERIQRASKALNKIQALITLKCSNVQSLTNLKCNCLEKQKLLSQRYQRQIQAIQQSYESKISLLVQEADTSGSSNPKKVPKQIQEQLKMMEERVLIKDKQIMDLQKQIRRLRRLNEQRETLCYEKQRFIRELNQQIQQKNAQVSKQLMKIQELKKKAGETQGQINIEKQNEIQKTREGIDYQEQSIDHRSKGHSSAILTSNHLQKFIRQNKNPLSLAFFHHIPLPDETSKKEYSFYTKIKELQLQIQVLTQENNLADLKIIHLEEQLKDHESVEERMQTQSQVLKDQLKRMNLIIKQMDECCVAVIQWGHASPQKLDNIDWPIKFKDAYKKKFPVKSSSVKKK